MTKVGTQSEQTRFLVKNYKYLAQWPATINSVTSRQSYWILYTIYIKVTHYNRTIPNRTAAFQNFIITSNLSWLTKVKPELKDNLKVAALSWTLLLLYNLAKWNPNCSTILNFHEYSLSSYIKKTGKCINFTGGSVYGILRNSYIFCLISCTIIIKILI